MTQTPRAGTTRIGSFRLQVSGLKELRAALRELDAALPTELRGVNKRVVEEIIVPDARGRAQAARPAPATRPRPGHGRYHWADVVASIRGVSSQTSAAVLFGSTARTKGWMMGWEFGSLGNNGLRHKSRNNPAHPELSNTSQFPPWRGAGAQSGYFFFPAIRASGPRIVDAYATALERFVAARVPQGAGTPTEPGA